MKIDAQTEVLICGAGATGLTLAIELARRDIRFTIIEKLDSPFRGSRGKGIQPRTQEIFEDLGILDKVASVGGSYPPQRVYRDDGGFEDSDIGEKTGATPAEPYQIPLMVAQFLTEALLRERLLELGHTVNYGTELLGFAQNAGAVEASLRNANGDKTISAQYLVGADGGRSFVRHALDVGFPGKTLSVRALVADVNLRGLSRAAWHRFNEGSRESQISLCPLAGTDMFQVQAPIPIEGEVDLSPQGLSRMVASRAGRSDIVIERVFWASAFRMNARLADRYREGRIFLAGDAAHIHPPTGGQGLNTSVQDAYNLGWKLAAVIKGAPLSLLDSFEEERRTVAAQVLGLSTRLLEAAKRGSNRRGREVQQLDIGYPESSLAGGASEGHSGILAGDRAPDAPIRGAGGQPERLFKLFQGTHWTLLGYEVDRQTVLPRRGLRVHTFGRGGDLIDENHHFQDAYELLSDTWVLVRPDGYVGAIFSSEHLDRLESYFGQVGLGTEGPNCA